MFKRINIAVDGYSSCGKGTLAKGLAASLKYTFIDTGAMYRAVTLYFIRTNISIQETPGLASTLQNVKLDFQYDDSGNQITLLNGENVENEIRQMQVSKMVSPVSKLPSVREFLTQIQKQLAEMKGVVMDGRDIGTVVLPDAELKIFMTASPEIRARRRFDELQRNGNSEITFEEVLQNINERDRIDSSRELSPLKPAEDAVVIDNSFLSKTEQLAQVLDLAVRKIDAE